MGAIIAVPDLSFCAKSRGSGADFVRPYGLPLIVPYLLTAPVRRSSHGDRVPTNWIAMQYR
jgi:hypothetical protein